MRRDEQLAAVGPDADLIAAVERHLAACAPRGIPASHSEVTAVRVVSDNRQRRVLEADMVMYDGDAALLRITEHRPTFGDPMYSHRWFMDRPVFWQDGAWHRGEEGTRIWDTSPAAAACPPSIVDDHQAPATAPGLSRLRVAHQPTLVRLTPNPATPHMVAMISRTLIRPSA